MTIFRIALFCIGLLSATFFSPVLASVCIVVLSVRFSAWEAVVIGIAMDMLWLPYHSALFSFPWCTAVALLLVWGFGPLRREFLR